jgi:ADP-heptose:LPS heptosyltransferase
MVPSASPEASADSDPTHQDRKPGIARGLHTTRPPQADRILIVRLGALGDVVRTLPAASALRSLYPGAHVSWMVEPGAAGVVDAAGFIDETLVFPRRELVEFLQAADGLSFARRLIGFVRRVRDRRFDLVLDFHGILKSGLLTRLSGAPLRYGFGPSAAREFSHLFVNRRVELANPRMSRYERNAALVSALSSQASFPTAPFLQASPLAAARLAARLRRSNHASAGDFVLIHPGSSPRALYKRYAASAWGDVAQRLSKQGIPVLIASGPSRHEKNLVEEIRQASGGTAIAATETRSVDDLLALMTRASVFVSCDSGPLHAASLVGIPVVQLLGPTDPAQNEPWPHTVSRRVHFPLPCSPCRKGCADATCMRAIPPTLVVDKICELRNAVARSAAPSAESSK